MDLFVRKIGPKKKAFGKLMGPIESKNSYWETALAHASADSYAAAKVP